MKQSKVTIGIPTLNREGYLKIALESALAQTYGNLEIVVSNNACTDGTAAMLAGYVDPRMKVLVQTTKLSMVGNWNACLAAATGEYFLLLSDDDVLEPEAIEAMVAGFEGAERPERVGMVYAGGRVIDSVGKVIRIGQTAPKQEAAPDVVLGLMNSKRDTWPCSILFRRSDMGEGYSSDFLMITDAAMWVQAVARRGVAVYVDRQLVSYRAHQNLTSTSGSSVWHEENRKFVEYAIACFEREGIADAKKIREIRRALSRLNARLAIYMPLDQPNRRNGAVLREYGRQLPKLTSVYGVSLLVRGILILWVPRGVKRVVKRLRGRA